MIDDEIGKYINWVDARLIDLSDAGAVAFGLTCFRRQRLIIEGLAGNKREYKWTTKIRQAEDEWWKWCESGVVPITLVGEEARKHSELELEKQISNLKRVMLTGLTTCDALFSGLEEGDYRCAKYTASMNIGMINAIEDELTVKDFERLILREISRQESELSLLLDGFFSDTREKLTHTVPDQLLFDNISLTDELWQK